MNNENDAGCVVTLIDGSRCPEPPILGRYCKEHEGEMRADLEIFKVLAEHYRQDLREFWLRNNFYLVVDAALVSVFISQTHSDVRLILGLFGMVISAFWYLVARGSLISIAHWRREITQLDKAVDRLEIWHRVESSVTRRRWERPFWITHWLPVAFGLGWLVLLLIAFL